jgi:nitrite reductase/ring-hydroxylating ferredoxin subunit
VTHASDAVHPSDPPDAEPTGTRRGFSLAGAAMAGGLAAGYGAFALICGRFLYPARGQQLGWMLVAPVREIAAGHSLRFRTPAGATVNITRRSQGESADDFMALSSVCPHLGCQVHWEPGNNRYFCPCHNGTFDAEGRGTGGPPGDAGQSLPRYPLKVEGGLLYIEVPMRTLADAGEVVDPDECPEGPGHDPCLRPRSGHGGRPA